MLLILWFVNFAISCFNAWTVGHIWNFSKMLGGFFHFLTWMVAVMAGAGFTWCYSLALAYLVTLFPITDEATGIAQPILTAADIKLYLDFIYILLILPLLGSGMAITAFSWAQLWRRRNLANGATAAWNTYAQISNMTNAFNYAPKAFDNVSSFFKSDDSEGAKGKLMILLVAIAIFGGVLTAVVIARRAMRDSKFLIKAEDF